MNNHDHPIPFRPGTVGVPIIGQPFEVKGGFPTVQIVCTCHAREPLLLIGANVVRCPACGRGFACAVFSFDASTGQIGVKIGLVVAAREAPPS